MLSRVGFSVEGDLALLAGRGQPSLELFDVLDEFVVRISLIGRGGGD
jgi:hypothetical protein